MKNLTKEQSKQKAQIAQALAEVEGELQNAIHHFNEQMTALFAPIEELQGRYNELIADARVFTDAVHEEQEGYMGDRSDQWREGDSGQAYEEWAGTWTVDLEEVEIDLPEPIEEVALDAADLFRDLPDHP